MTALSLPSGARFTSCEWALQEYAATNTLASGAVQSMQLGEPLWSVKAATIPMSCNDAGVWEAWFLSLRLAGRFTMTDPRRPYPLAYGSSYASLMRSGGGAFNGTAIVGAVSGLSVPLTSLPAGYQAKAGDWISLRNGGLDTIHMITSEITASAGGVATVPVLPAPRSGVASGSTARLAEAVVTMALIPGKFTIPKSPTLEPVTFEAIQVLA